MLARDGELLGDEAPGEARLVTSWDSDPEGVATLAAAIAQL